MKEELYIDYDGKELMVHFKYFKSYDDWSAPFYYAELEAAYDMLDEKSSALNLDEYQVNDIEQIIGDYINNSVSNGDWYD